MRSSVNEFGPALPVITRDNAPNPARMRRDTLLLDGVWTLQVNDRPAQPVLVPFAPQAKVNGISVPSGPARLAYATIFELPDAWDGAILHFEGADHEAEVVLNGQVLGRHAGAYDPFSFVVPAAVLALGIRSGAARLHALAVRVRDSSASRTIPCGKQERKPAEGCIFYGNMSGLWKSVWIERAGETHIADFHADADSTGRLTLAATVAGASDGHQLVLSLAPEGGPEAIRVGVPVRDGRAAMVLRLDDVEPWSPDNPRLYFGALSLLDADGRAVDVVETHMGFRDFVMRDGYYHLNGEPFYLQGLLNQAIYPDTLYTPTDTRTLTDFEETRAAGFNGERRHQTTPRHRDLWLADRMGYWLSIEMPSARNLLDKKHRDRAIDEWKRIVRAYAWHPSVLFLVPGNENWGLLTHPYHRVRASDAERERFQYELGLATEEVAPRHMPYAANDGWKVVTAHREGRVERLLDPSRLMFNIHDYAGNERLRATYGALPRFPEPGTWGANARYVFHSRNYGYDGQTPMILSEVGGRALLNRSSKGVFAYGTIHRDPDAWASEVAELIELLGDLPVLRGGYVLTQTRDAGNDPADPTSLGELNGILDADGVPKHAGSALCRANERARAAWARLAHGGAPPAVPPQAWYPVGGLEAAGA